MLMLRKFHGLTAAILALCLTSCIKSKNPLSDPDRSVPDAQLYGVWVQKTGGVINTMVIGRTSELSSRKDVPVGLMRVTRSSINSKGFVDSPTEHYFYATSLDSGTYLSLLDVVASNVPKIDPSNTKAVKGYNLLKYRVSGDKLEYSVGNANSGSLTDSTDNLVSYLNRGGGNALFPENTKEVYIRILTP